jgi:hypothetical protein
MEIVHNLLLLRIPTKKVAGFEIRRSLGPELKRQVFFSETTYPSLRWRFIQKTSNIPVPMRVQLRPVGK